MKTVTLTWDQYRQLEAAMMDLSCKLERAECVIEDLAEGYFGHILKPDNLWKLEAGFNKNKIMADIAFDYLYDSKKLVEQAEKLLEGVQQ